MGWVMPLKARVGAMCACACVRVQGQAAICAGRLMVRGRRVHRLGRQVSYHASMDTRTQGEGSMHTHTHTHTLTLTQPHTHTHVRAHSAARSVDILKLVFTLLQLLKEVLCSLNVFGVPALLLVHDEWQAGDACMCCCPPQFHCPIKTGRLSRIEGIVHKLGINAGLHTYLDDEVSHLRLCHVVRGNVGQPVVVAEDEAEPLQKLHCVGFFDSNAKATKGKAVAEAR
mmetsp:Transcript_18285/g.46479  ORF Transcript_18285/g.46479 Transcript_18285/m.46479 type:complete len:227 (+) Transcript_18285:36-716(+)